MTIAVFGDVHGNLPALEAMLRDAGRVDAYICVGDVVNYGPWSNECVDLIMSLNCCTVIRGNHEKYFLAKRYDGKNKLVKKFFDFCIKKFDKYDVIKNFKDTYVFGKYFFTHTINNEIIYPNSKTHLNKNYVIGHSHYQFKLNQDGYTLYNTGSVGQNRQYINVVNYLLFYPEKDSFEMRRLLYNEKFFLDKMKTTGYPQECIDYYDQKRRKKK